MIDANTKQVGSAVFPVLRYRNLPTAIDWLCEAFGFESYHVTVANNGGVQFAQLTFGDAMIMVSPVRSSAFDKLLRQPDEVGGAETQVCYFFVDDAFSHCARAKAAGAEIVFDIKHSGNRGLTYSCRDPEGHLWNFGSYNPWERQALARVSRYHQGLRPAIYSIVVAGLLLTVAMLVMPFGGVGERDEPRPSKSADIVTGSTTPIKDPQPALEPLDRDESAIAAAERAATDAQRQLTAVQIEKEVLRKAAADSHAQLIQALNEKEAAEQLAKQVQEKLGGVLIAKTAAERSAKDARRQLAIDRAKRAAAESAKQTKETLPFPW